MSTQGRHTGKATFEWRPEGNKGVGHEKLQVKNPQRAVLRWEGIPSAKPLTWEGAWRVLGIAEATSTSGSNGAGRGACRRKGQKAHQQSRGKACVVFHTW